MNAYLTELGELLLKGGFVMPPLVFSALLLWFGLGYRFVMLFFGDRREVRELVELAHRGRLDRPNGVLAQAAKDGVELTKKNLKNLRYHLEERFYDHEMELAKFRAICTGVVQIAPLLGLLGTVSGMIDTFDALGDTTQSSQAGGVAGGISEALFSTQMGLMVAIPGLLIGRLLDKRQSAISDDLVKMQDFLTTEFNPSRDQETKV